MELVRAVRAMHAQFADRGGGMSAAAIKEWSRTINGTHSEEVMAARAASAKAPEAAAAAGEVGVCTEEGQRKAELQTLFEEWVSEGYRGSSEFRHALELLQQSAGGLCGGTLSADDLVEVYGVLIRDGKFWYVEHDVNQLGVWPSPDDGCGPERPPLLMHQPFEASFDYIFYDPSHLQLCAVRRPLSREQSALVYEAGVRFPCEWHMSDHLPVAACFSYRSFRTG